MAVTNRNGTLTSQQRYLPFGEVRQLPNYPTTQLTTDFGFTGQRALDGTGLMDYRARFYSQSLGRFIQPDSVIPNPGNPQEFNRYSYVNNAPMNFNDPSGHFKCGNLSNYLCKKRYQKWAHVGNDDDGNKGVFTEEQLNGFGFICGENVDPLVCLLYTNPSAFKFIMEADFSDPVMGNIVTSLICILVRQGCIKDGSDYLMDFDIIPTDGGVIWNRYAINRATDENSNLFLATWSVDSIERQLVAREEFPLGGGFLEPWVGPGPYATVYLEPSAINKDIVWRSTYFTVGTRAMMMNMNTSPGTITFTTSQTGPTTLTTTGVVSIGSRYLGSITLVGSLMLP